MNQMTLCLLLFALMIVGGDWMCRVQNCAEFFWQLNGCHYGFYVRGSCGSDPYSDDQSDIPDAV